MRVLFLPEAIGLSHVVRLVVLARALDPAIHEVHFACDPRFESVVGRLPFRCHEVKTLPVSAFDASLKSGGPVYSEEALMRYVTDERVLLGRVRPDVVVGDFRVSLSVSARVAGVPYLNVMNAYWSPRALVRHVVPEVRAVEVLGRRAGQMLFDVVRPWVYAIHGRPLARVRRYFGLPGLGADARALFTDADRLLFPDVPQLFSMSILGENERFIGPIVWSPSIPLPAWWHAAEEAAVKRRVVYVNLGVTGGRGMLQKVLDALAMLPVTIVAATAGRSEALDVPSNAFLADYLPGDRATRISDVVICNGGSLMAYQALGLRKQLIGLASNTDQFLNMAVMEDAGVGQLLPAGACSVAEIRAATVRALEDSSLKAQVDWLATNIRLDEGQEAFPKILEELPTRRPTPLDRAHMSHPFRSSESYGVPRLHDM